MPRIKMDSSHLIFKIKFSTLFLLFWLEIKKKKNFFPPFKWDYKANCLKRDRIDFKMAQALLFLMLLIVSAVSTTPQSLTTRSSTTTRLETTNWIDDVIGGDKSSRIQLSVGGIIILILAAFVKFGCDRKKANRQNQGRNSGEIENFRSSQSSLILQDDASNQSVLIENELEDRPHNCVSTYVADRKANQLIQTNQTSTMQLDTNQQSRQSFDQKLDVKPISLAEWSYLSSHDYIEYYFHYTSRESVHQIMSDQKLRPTSARVTKFGHGIFFTELDPSNSDRDLIENNYRDNYKYLERIQYSIAIPKYQIRVRPVNDNFNRSILRCDYEIDLNMVDFRLINRDMN